MSSCYCKPCKKLSDKCEAENQTLSKTTKKVLPISGLPVPELTVCPPLRLASFGKELASTNHRLTLEEVREGVRSMLWTEDLLELAFPEVAASSGTNLDNVKDALDGAENLANGVKKVEEDLNRAKSAVEKIANVFGRRRKRSQGGARYFIKFPNNNLAKKVIDDFIGGSKTSTTTTKATTRKATTTATTTTKGATTATETTTKAGTTAEATTATATTTKATITKATTKMHTSATNHPTATTMTSTKAAVGTTDSKQLLSTVATTMAATTSASGGGNQGTLIGQLKSMMKSKGFDDLLRLAIEEKVKLLHSNQQLPLGELISRVRLVIDKEKGKEGSGEGSGNAKKLLNKIRAINRYEPRTETVKAIAMMEGVSLEEMKKLLLFMVARAGNIRKQKVGEKQDTLKDLLEFSGSEQFFGIDREKKTEEMMGRSLRELRMYPGLQHLVGRLIGKGDSGLYSPNLASLLSLVNVEPQQIRDPKCKGTFFLCTFHLSLLILKPRFCVLYSGHKLFFYMLLFILTLLYVTGQTATVQRHLNFSSASLPKHFCLFF